MRLAFLSLCVVFLGGLAPAGPPPQGARALVPCPVAGSTETVRCMRLEVPENWGRPGGRKISLNVIVMPKIGPGPEQAPMIWLEGGPGIPGTQSASLYAGELRFHRDRRAVVLFDQRGTGQSDPLHCPSLEHAPALADAYPLADVAVCRRMLRARADLDQYTTRATARDLDAIRAALGCPRVDLAGLSYGTMLAQAYMKLYPSRVRAAALIGSVPLTEKLPLHHALNGEKALRQVFQDCRAEPGCDKAYPRLASDWSELMGRLSRSPIKFESVSGSVTVRPGPFGEMVRTLLNTVEGQRRLPLMISHAVRGDFGPFLTPGRAEGPDLAEGLYLSVTCPAVRRIRAGEVSRDTAGTSFGRYRIDQQVGACRRWGSAPVDLTLLRPLRSDIPVLFLSGGRDATTPTSWAQDIAAGLPRSRVVVIAPMTHVPVGLSNMVCPDQIMDAFFVKASADNLDTSCVSAMKPPRFDVSLLGRDVL